MDAHFLHIVHNAMLLGNVQPVQWCRMSSGKPQAPKTITSFLMAGWWICSWTRASSLKNQLKKNVSLFKYVVFFFNFYFGRGMCRFILISLCVVCGGVEVCCLHSHDAVVRRKRMWCRRLIVKTLLTVPVFHNIGL